MYQTPKLSAAVVLLLCYASVLAGVRAYSQVQTVGSAGAEDAGPRIFKALNVDLIFPKTFNSSENVISTTPRTTTTTTATTMTAKTPLAANYEQQQQQQESAAIFVTPASAAQYAAPAAVTANPNAYLNPAPPQTNEDQQQQEEQQKQQEQQSEEDFEQQQYTAATGRAVDYQSAYPFGQLITPLIKNAAPAAARPAYVEKRPHYVRPAAQPPQTSALNKIVYPQASYRQQQQQQQQQRPRQPSRAEWQKLRGKAQISDRFTPSEAVASSQFGKNKHNHDHSHDHDHSHSGGGNSKTPAASNVVQQYVPPKDLYSFPPNIDARYPSPSQDPKAAVPTSSINSYVAPPSGTLTNGGGYPLATAASDSNGYKYTGPLNPGYLPPAGADGDKPSDEGKGADNAADDGAGDDGGDANDSIGVLPASAMDGGGGDDAKNAGDGGPPMDQPGADDGDDGDDHDHDHPHDHHPLSGYDTNKEYATPPPGWLEQHPDAAHDHPHDHPHEHDHSHDHHFDFHDTIEHDHYPSFPIYHPHSYPELIYDDHHHHHVEPPPPPPPTTPAPPPPEPAPEPRVKKYSYFYIGRKLWYIPLYFTVWFSFYVLWLILKSIARHKVNLPNHYVTRRSLPANTEAQAQEYINQLTVSVLGQIEGFKRKYLT